MILATISVIWGCWRIKKWDYKNVLSILRWYSRSRSFPGITMSHSRSQNSGMEFPFPFPFPKIGNGIFIPVPVPKSWECNFSFPFPFPKFGNGLSHSRSRSQMSKSHSRSPLSQTQSWKSSCCQGAWSGIIVSLLPLPTCLKKIDLKSPLTLTLARHTFLAELRNCSSRMAMLEGGARWTLPLKGLWIRDWSGHRINFDKYHPVTSERCVTVQKLHQMLTSDC